MGRDRMTVVFVIAIMTLGIPVYAGGSPEASGNEAGQPSERVLTVLKAGAEPIWDEYYTRAVADFEEANPGVTVEYEAVGWADVNTKLNTMFASNTAPDIVAAAVTFQSVRAELGQFIPLDSFIADWDEAESVQDRIFELGTYDGSVYGIGYHWDPRVLVYRRDLFSKAGLDPDDPPNSWEELRDAAIALAERNGDVVVQSGFDLPSTAGHPFLQTFALQNGAVLIDPETQAVQFDTPEAVEALAFLADLYREGITGPFAGNRMAEYPFMRGTSAMSYLSPSLLAAFIEANPDRINDIGIITDLGESRSATFGGLYQLFITSQADDPELAWSFVQALMSEDETKRRTLDVGSPVVRKDLRDWYFEQGPFNEGIYESAMVSEPWPNVPWSGQYRTYLGQAYEEAVFGRLSPREALRQAGDALAAEVE